MIGSFGDIIFEVSDTKVVSLNNEISRNYKSKIIEHNPIFGPGMLRHQGRELSEISFSITLLTSLCDDVLLEKQKLVDMLEIGVYSNLVFGGQVYGEHPFLITDISEKDSFYDTKLERFDQIELNVNLKEYIENPKDFNNKIEQKKIKISTLFTEEKLENVEAEQQKEVSKTQKK